MSAGPYSIGSDRLPGLSKLIEEAGEVIQVAAPITCPNCEGQGRLGPPAPCPTCLGKGEMDQADVERLLTEHNKLLARVIATSEVDCVKTWGKHPMKCFPNDKCSFCRARECLQ